MKFIIKNTNNAYEHISNSLLIYIYKFSKTNYDENENSVLHVNIETLYGYQSNVDYLEETFQNLHVMLSRDTYIEFEDELCKQYVANELGDNYGVTEKDVKDLTINDIYNTFRLPEGVEKFNELRYFKSLTVLRSFTNTNENKCDMFLPAQNTLKEIDLKNVTTIYGPTFSGFTQLEKVNNHQYITDLINGGHFRNTGLKTINIPNLSSLNNNNSTGSIFRDCHNLISATIDGPVTLINARMFSDCENLKTVSGFSNITLIKEGVFNGCTSLETLNINFSNLTTIESSVFQDCTSLDFTNLDFSNVTSFGQECFRNSNLTSITFNNVDSISFGGNGGTFRNTKLTSLTIPNNCTNISNTSNFVRECTNLTSLTIPNGLINTLYSYFAADCTSLQTVYIGESVTKLQGNVFQNCTSLTSVNTLDNVTDIERQAFYNCTSLTNIGSLKNCTSINYQAFQNCTKLSNLGSLEKIESIGHNAFNSLGLDLENPVLPNLINMPYLTTIYGSAFANANIKSIKCDSLQTINDNTFENSTLESAEFSSALNLNKSAFQNCKKLTSISIPNVTSIGYSCFKGCTSLNTFSAPSCISISGNVFQDMGTVDTINLPLVTTLPGGDIFRGTTVTNLDLRNVTSLDIYAFRYAQFVNLDIRSLETLSINFFQNMTSLKSVNVSSLQSGPRYLFYGTSLETINLPSMTVLPQDGFKNCSKLTTVTLSASATEIGQSCFNTCSKLANIDLSHVQIIRGWAFENCTSLASIDISSCTEILEGAFKGCTGLNSDIVIPATVTNLPKECFYNDLQINSITLMASSVVTYNQNAIPEAVSVTFPIYVPDILVDSYKATSGWNNAYVKARIKPISEKPTT